MATKFISIFGKAATETLTLLFAYGETLALLKRADDQFSEVIVIEQYCARVEVFNYDIDVELEIVCLWFFSKRFC